MDTEIEQDGKRQFNVKSGCLGMIAMMIAGAVLLTGLILMLGLTPDNDRALGFILFFTGVLGFAGFFAFASYADQVAAFIKNLTKKK